MAEITLRNVTKVFGETRALNNVSLDIPSGGVFVIMGLSGSGKSTLIRHINRLIEPTSGTITFDGRDVTALDAHALRDFRRRSVSMVFQGFGLMPHMTVLDNAAFGLVARGEPKEAAHAAARDWLHAVGLDQREGAYPDQLSGGMKQRVGLARALATGTDTLLMDEAFSALDPLIRADMQDLLLELRRKSNTTVVFVTHDLAEAVKISDRIAILRDGEVVQTGTPAEIIDHPADAYVARFVSVAGLRKAP